MSIETCPVTGEPLSPGETVSRAAVARLRACVSDLPDLMQDLQYAVAGLKRGSGGGGWIPAAREPVNLQLMLDIDEMGDTLHTWAASLEEHAGSHRWVHRRDWDAVRGVFSLHANAVRRWEEAPQMIDEVTYAVHRLERLASPGARASVFVGRCECGWELLARPGAPEVECRQCGAVWDVEASRAALVEAALGRPLPLPRAVEVARIVSPDVRYSTVRSWISRGRLTPALVDDRGRRLYRAGDIIARGGLRVRRGVSFGGRVPVDAPGVQHYALA